MSTKFFNNVPGNTLFDKLKGIASEMATFDRFLAVVGFFRSSGYFKLRTELDIPLWTAGRIDIVLDSKSAF